jgi:hypothetical protein
MGTTQTRNVLIDVTAPTTSNVGIPPSLVGGAMTSFSATVTDDLDLWSVVFSLDYGAPAPGVFIPFGSPKLLGDMTAWNTPLTTTEAASQAIPFVRALEVTTGGHAPGGVAAASAVAVQATTSDVAGNTSATANLFSGGTVPAPVAFVAKWPAPAGPLGTFQVLAPAAAFTLGIGGGAACVAPAANSVTLSAEATGPTGTMPNPFAGGTVYYYLVTDGDAVVYDDAGEVYTLLGSVSGSGASFTDDGVVAPMLRHYNYAFTLSGQHAAIQALGAPVVGAKIVAIGVDAAGDALITQQNVNISTSTCS